MAMKKYHKWADIKKRHDTPKQIEESRKWAENEVLKMNLREVRRLAGKTQVDVSKAAKMTQGEVSSFEMREDHLVSTLRRIITALGGELEITARFGDKSVRLHGV
jgi:hypothetical protein